MYVLALILDASSSIEGKKPVWSFTKDTAREILDIILISLDVAWII